MDIPQTEDWSLMYTLSGKRICTFTHLAISAYVLVYVNGNFETEVPLREIQDMLENAHALKDTAEAVWQYIDSLQAQR